MGDRGIHGDDRIHQHAEIRSGFLLVDVIGDRRGAGGGARFELRGVVSAGREPDHPDALRIDAARAGAVAHLSRGALCVGQGNPGLGVIHGQPVLHDEGAHPYRIQPLGNVRPFEVEGEKAIGAARHDHDGGAIRVLSQKRRNGRLADLRDVPVMHGRIGAQLLDLFGELDAFGTWRRPRPQKELRGPERAVPGAAPVCVGAAGS